FLRHTPVGPAPLPCRQPDPRPRPARAGPRRGLRLRRPHVFGPSRAALVPGGGRLGAALRTGARGLKSKGKTTKTQRTQRTKKATEHTEVTEGGDRDRGGKVSAQREREGLFSVVECLLFPFVLLVSLW